MSSAAERHPARPGRRAARARPPVAGVAGRGAGLVAALLIGVNLRPAITGVAALLDETRVAYGLSTADATVLATLPVIAFGLTAPIGPWLARRLGVARALAWSMAALAAALVVRVVASVLLLPGTFLAGVAIMAAGTLLPQYLKELRASGLWIGLSSMSFGVGAALGAGLVVPAYTATGGSAPLALGAWALLAVAAASATAFAALRGGEPRSTGAQPRLRLPRGGGVTIGLVTAVFGLQALLYFAVTAWLPQFLADRGEPPAVRGALLAWFSIAGFVPTLVTPVLARMPRVLRWFGPGLGIAIAIGLGLLYLASGDRFVLVVGVLGAVQSAAFGLGITLIVNLSANTPSAGVVSAIAQGGGYAIAGAGSLLIGVVHEASGGWEASFALMAVVAVAFAVAVALVIRRAPVDLVEADRAVPEPAGR
ncbi:MFS transporter [Agromyces endophyticus]|uniref:MFS transporter n=1 Tax=Agromyces sp. H17E-10 TaxID=2932244 RepID=UPI001FD0F934|nr:MFS transporter [Agromyces sp. H17E-10]UOQ88599.1 MFS transporter [Agromyces sp. H17E-10]